MSGYMDIVSRETDPYIRFLYMYNRANNKYAEQILNKSCLGRQKCIVFSMHYSL